MKLNKSKNSEGQPEEITQKVRQAKIRKKGKVKIGLDNTAWMGHLKKKNREKTMEKVTQGAMSREHGGPRNTW